MKDNEIEKAATDSCVIDNNIFNPELIPYYEQGFKEGAKWRINSVWHNAHEVPKKEEYILVCINGGQPVFITWYINVTPTKWDNIVKEHRVTKWAYIDDLTPDTEE